jgi:hypothetical protein
MSTEYQVPVAAPVEDSDSTPTFNNGITPQGQPAPPLVTELVPRVSVDPSVAPVITLDYSSPVEAVPGVGGIPGVQAEE